MVIRYPSAARIAGFLLALVVAVSLVSVSAVALSRTEVGSGHENLDWAYSRELSVWGFVLVQEYYEGAAVSIYVGPPTKDVPDLVAGPRLVLEVPPRFVTSGGVFEDVAAGSAAYRDARCAIDVKVLRTGQEPASNWGIDKQQRRDVRAGRLLVVRLGVLCGDTD